jgi:prophage regulatory protein
MRTAETEQAAPARLLAVKTVAGLTSLSRHSIYRLAKQGDFPTPVQVGPRRVAWRQSDVTAWLESRPPATWA